MKLRALTLFLVLGGSAAGTRADTPPDSGDGATDQLTLPKGRFVLDAFLEISLSDGAVFKPFSIAPDLWYGITDDLTVGVVHSRNGETSFWGGTGSSLCLTGKNNGCPNVYQTLGADVRYQLKVRGLAVALDGGLFFHSFDPVQLALKIGAVGRWRHARFTVEAAPALFFGLTNRKTDVTVGGETVSVTTNGDALSLPVSGFYAVMPKLSAYVQLGLILPFQDTGDRYAIPLSVGAHYLVTDRLDLTAAFTLTRLIAGSDGGFDGRALTIGGSYAL